MNVIFLDIEGPMIPSNSVNYDFSAQAVDELKQLLDDTGSLLVISSSYRMRGLQRMRDLFSHYGLGEYVAGITPYCIPSQPEVRALLMQGYSSRVVEIRMFLMQHPEVAHYVAFDDQDLSRGLEGHFVRSFGLNRLQTDQARLMLAE